MSTINNLTFSIKTNVELATVNPSAIYQNIAFIASTSKASGRILLKANGEYTRNKINVEIAETEASGRMNALASIIQVMQEGIEVGQGIYLFYVNKIVLDAINTNSYKLWLATGKFKNGSRVSAEELTLWAHFVDTYASCFERVEFRNISEAVIRGEDRKPVALDSKEFASAPRWKQINHKLSTSAWDIVADSVGLNEPRFVRGEIREVAQEETNTDNTSEILEALNLEAM